MDAFVKTFWDPQAKYFYGQSNHKPTGHGNSPQNGKYADFWWEARLWEVVMDAYETTGEQRYLTMIDDVYDGFLREFPTFGSEFNDDVMWWAQGATRAYAITGNQRYLDTAKSLYSRVMKHEDSALGGGVWWRSDRKDQKNVATNAPTALTATRLYSITKDAKYLDQAKRLFAYVDTHLHDNGHVYDHLESDGRLVKWDFTYNFGTYISAALALFDLTGDKTYFTKAVAAADWATTYLVNGGTLRNEGVGDGGGFKSHLVRALHDLVTKYDQNQYRQFMINNASQAWANRRTSDNIMSNDWSATPTKHGIETLASSAAVTAVLLAPGPVPAVSANEWGVYEVENADVANISTESHGTGWTGRGYLGGWNRDGQQVTIHVNVQRAGIYKLNFRYAAAAGDATRQIMINGKVVAPEQLFPETKDWSDWQSSMLKVGLKRGHNSIQIRFDSATDSHNWVNLDKLLIMR